MATITVSVHDVAPRTAEASRRWVDDMDRRGVRVTLLVVPGPWSKPTLREDRWLCSWLREAEDAGHEIALHGWSHRADVTHPSPSKQAVGRLVARGAAEFWPLDRLEARTRLRRGLAVLAELGFTVRGFTPPGWLASPGTTAALADVGLRYTTSHTTVTDLHTGHRHAIPVLCNRPGSRGERVGARLLAGVTARRARGGRPVRVALHPQDRERPGLREAAIEAIDLARAAGAVPVTYASLVCGPAARPGPTWTMR